MDNKKTQNTICMKCGKVQVRTDIHLIKEANFIFLDKKYFCPYCEINTNHVVTNNVKVLRKKLIENCNSNIERRILELISR